MEPFSLAQIDQTGLAVVRDFFDAQTMAGIEDEIFNVVCGVARSYGLKEPSGFEPGYVDKVVTQFVAENPKSQPFIYDRFQQMSSLLAVPGSSPIKNLSEKLLGTKRLGVWPRTQLRMDLPNDRVNVIRWHNDYMYNRGTKDSYTFWFPFSTVEEQMGPLQFALNSHKVDLAPVRTGGPERFDYDLPESTVRELNVVKPIIKRGDLVVFHSLLWHTGQLNKTTDRARLSGLFRVQNLNTIEVNP